MVEEVRRLLLGRRLRSVEAQDERLTKTRALGAFGLDALSSVAYGPDEIFYVLILAGAVGTRFSLPVALAIVALLAMVVTSYRQTLFAYPNGGGSYTVARENLGTQAGLLAAAALVGDYPAPAAASVPAGGRGTRPPCPRPVPPRPPIARGVAMLDDPEPRHAARTLTTLAVLLGALVLGVTGLGHAIGAVPSDQAGVIAQIGHAVAGDGPLFWLVQLSTALILLLAANTSFNGFPMLAAIMAHDWYLPRQFVHRGLRLSYSNCILVIGTLAIGLVVLFNG